MDYQIMTVSIPALVFGIIEVIKKTKIPNEFMPFVSLLVGVVISLIATGISSDSILAGLGYGAAAIGCYELIDKAVPSKLNEEDYEEYNDI